MRVESRFTTRESHFSTHPRRLLPTEMDLAAGGIDASPQNWPYTPILGPRLSSYPSGPKARQRSMLPHASARARGGSSIRARTPDASQNAEPSRRIILARRLYLVTNQE